MYNHGPVKSIKEDILYRKELVEAVCDLIIEADTSESFTIGIYGKWGTGKTSFVNFIKEQIGTEVGISRVGGVTPSHSTYHEERNRSATFRIPIP